MEDPSFQTTENYPAGLYLVKVRMEEGIITSQPILK